MGSGTTGGLKGSGTTGHIIAQYYNVAAFYNLCMLTHSIGV